METNKHVDVVIADGSRFQVVDPSLRHIRELSLSMRAADRLEITRSTGGSLTVTEIIEQAIELSMYSRVALFDGRLAVMWGLAVPNLLSGRGYPWAMTTRVVEDHVRAFLSFSRFYVDEMRSITPSLTVLVDGEYSAALSWLRRIGFDVDSEVTINTHPFRIATVEAA